MFAQNLNRAVIPQITKSYSGGNTDRTMQLVIYSSKYSFFLMLLPAIPILLETKYIMTLWLKDVPDYTVIFVQVMIINALIQIMNSSIPAAVQATGKIKYFQIILSTITLLALPVAYFLFKAGYKPYYMPLTFTGVSLLTLVVQQILLKRLIQFNVKEFMTKAYLRMMLVTIPVLPLFAAKLIIEESLFRFAGLTMLSIFWILILIYLVGMEKTEREIIQIQLKQKLANVRLKRHK